MNQKGALIEYKACDYRTNKTETDGVEDINAHAQHTRIDDRTAARRQTETRHKEAGINTFEKSRNIAVNSDSDRTKSAKVDATGTSWPTTSTDNTIRISVRPDKINQREQETHTFTLKI